MHSLLTLLLQIAVILVVARVVGLLFRKINQPQVVGEMVAGIILGPSLLGWVAPGISAQLFVPGSLEYLNVISQVGLILFMFLVGLELDPRLLNGNRKAAVAISQSSIIVPFVLGGLLAMYLYPRLSGPPVSLTAFTLFMCAAMSITAFPVLARILLERDMLRTKIGALAISCAAVDDVTAWCILAVVIAIVRSGQNTFPVWVTIGGTALFVVLMVLAVRPALGFLVERRNRRGVLSEDMTALILLLVLAAAWTTEWLGIHALFGAFILGAVMPKDHEFVSEITEKLGHITMTFFLPIFFALAGLRASIGSIAGLEMWFFFALVLATAVLGKFGGAAGMGRLVGLSWRDAGIIGTLMNTRGLVELVILNIGFDLGVIPPPLYTMMVLMALITTFMTTPIIMRLYPESARQQELVLAGGGTHA